MDILFNEKDDDYEGNEDNKGEHYQYYYPYQLSDEEWSNHLAMRGYNMLTNAYVITVNKKAVMDGKVRHFVSEP